MDMLMTLKEAAETLGLSSVLARSLASKGSAPHQWQIML